MAAINWISTNSILVQSPKSYLIKNKKSVTAAAEHNYGGLIADLKLCIAESNKHK